MPVSYRRRTGDSVTLVTVLDEPCIAGYPSDEVTVAELGWEQPVSSIFRQRMDSRGRITIPKRLREYAGISNVVVFVSSDDVYFELWGQVNWEIEGVIASSMRPYEDNQ